MQLHPRRKPRSPPQRPALINSAIFCFIVIIISTVVTASISDNSSTGYLFACLTLLPLWRVFIVIYIVREMYSFVLTTNKAYRRMSKIFWFEHSHSGVAGPCPWSSYNSLLRGCRTITIFPQLLNSVEIHDFVTFSCSQWTVLEMNGIAYI